MSKTNWNKLKGIKVGIIIYFKEDKIGLFAFKSCLLKKISETKDAELALKLFI